MRCDAADSCVRLTPSTAASVTPRTDTALACVQVKRRKGAEPPSAIRLLWKRPEPGSRSSAKCSFLCAANFS
ncbi:hypothetical protein GN956_G9973 [Arapaima gigas]